MSSVRLPKLLTVSVIIPAYQAAETIRRAIESVVTQTYPVNEILVIDDGSTDNLAAALEPFGSRVKLIRQERGGAAAARNRGLDEARSDLIAFLDADDTWKCDKLGLNVEVLLQQPDVGLVASRYLLQGGRGEQVRIAGPEVTWCDRPFRVTGPDLLTCAQATSTPTVMVRRKLVESERFDTSLRTAEDRDFWFRLLTVTHGYFISSALTVVHVRSNSLSNANIDLDCRCMLRVIDRYGTHLGYWPARRESSLVHLKWAQGLPGGWSALSHWFKSLWLWPLPYPYRRTKNWLARPRALLSILRRWGRKP